MKETEKRHERKGSKLNVGATFLLD